MLAPTLMKKILLLLGIVMLSGCHYSPKLNIDNQFEARHSSRNAKHHMNITAQTCPYRLTEFKDARSNKSLGRVAFSVIENDVTQWSIDALKTFNIHPDVNREYLQVKVSLVKAYIHSVNTAMAANIVFKVEKKSPEVKAFDQPQYYRGYSVSTNWATGRGEILDTLNEAMTDAISKMRANLDRQCR